MNGNVAGGGTPIQWPESERYALFAKHPEAQFPDGAQLQVGAEEVAVLLRDGMVVTTFGPGAHALSPTAVPALQMATDTAAPGFILGELYWVSTRPTYGDKFGGRCGEVRCPRTGATATTSVMGASVIRVADPPRFVISVATGGAADEMLRFIKGKLIHHIGACMAEWVAGGYFALTQLPAVGPQLAEVVPQHCQDLRDLGVEVVSLSDLVVRVS